MSVVSDSKDRLARQASTDVGLLMHELKALRDDLIIATDHATRMEHLTNRINDTLATLESFTINRVEIMRLDHTTLSETLCVVDADILMVALDAIGPECRRKIKQALDEFQDT
jgi:hypothetical protein